MVLQRARKTGPFDVENSRVSIYPDYTEAVQAKRATSTEVKKALRIEGIWHTLLFPLKLKIMWDGNTHFCLSPEEAWSWLETYRTGRDDQNSHELPLTRSWRKRRPSGDQPRRDRVLRPMKTQANQGKQAAIRGATSLTELPTSDKDRTSHTEAGEMEDSSDHESVVDPLGGLPHVTRQTPEDII
ncbi:hypothetical protein NDU88_002214 [Pleurodeles waltl]|uniref:Uncharacterized protein n=1 Tax=Pleurodeles waltl TaxID=8319 RepID=A0AAV7LBP5_PLEWA|nr:hypothetical protein NDU88_002214 [Pleurodeles waltl]